MGYRKLNALTVSDVYPITRIDDMLDILSEARYLSIFDFVKGYSQSPLDPDAQKKICFYYWYGTVCYHLG